MTLIKQVSYFFYLLFSIHLPANYRPLGAIFRKIRNTNAKFFLNKHGGDLNIEKGAKISPDIKIGKNSMLGENSRIYGGVTLGDNVLMGPDVKIYTRNHNIENRHIPIVEQGDSFKPVTIGDDVWIGANVIILPGVSIGTGSVIGAGSVVTKSVPEFKIVCGNPAMVKGSR